jgi:methylated-DNA-[protein]-cysteine S-methyltransferase
MELRQKIFSYLKTLPKGKTITYKSLAKRFQTSPRAVGQILKSNKDKSVPCYKVIRSDGKLGGYNKLLGISKKKLLEKEGVKF